MAKVTVSPNADCSGGTTDNSVSSLTPSYDARNEVFVTQINNTTVNVVCVKYGNGELSLIFPAGWTLDPQGFGSVRGNTVTYPDEVGQGTTKATNGDAEIEIELHGGQN